MRSRRGCAHAERGGPPAGPPRGRSPSRFVLERAARGCGVPTAPTGPDPDQQRFEPLGLLADTPYVDPDPALVPALEAGLAEGKPQMEAALQGQPTARERLERDVHAFDYNLDFFEVGAIDQPQWRSDDPRALPR